jgi:thioredoxin-related protein
MPTKQKEDMVRAPYVTLPLRGTRYFLLLVVKKVGCSFGLRITGENQSYKTARKYADNAFDISYVLTGRSEEFDIPWEEITVRMSYELNILRIKGII